MMKISHLNANQIDAVLMGSASRRAETHLAECESCRVRVSEAGAAIGDFRAVAVAWSERKSATMPTSLSAALAHKGSVGQPLAWSAAALSLFAVGMFTTMTLPRTRVPEAAQVQTSGAGVSAQGARLSLTAEDLASDNQMLGEIDRELGTSSAATPGVKDAPGEATQIEN